MPRVADAKSVASFHSRAKEALALLLGKAQFRPKQLDVLTAVCHHKQDVLAIMPTGSGKSAVFQLTGLLQKQGQCVVVVSPTIELMQNAVQELDAFLLRAQLQGQYKACALGSLDDDSKNEALALRGLFTWGELVCVRSWPLVSSWCVSCSVFLAPEKAFLLKDKLKAMCSNELISVIVVDEAHCASVW
jgi:ATP-dependent DNA helicase RecQ